MRAIFLDIDGVMATPSSVRLNYLLGRPPERQWYDPVSLSYLSRLVGATRAIVVLTSTWRSDLDSDDPHTGAIMRNLCGQLADAGAPVADATPVLPGSDRSGEIGTWLDTHPCEGYVIFDDLARFEARPEVCDGHLVLIEDSGGIRPQHFHQALSLFRQQGCLAPRPKEGRPT